MKNFYVVLSKTGTYLSRIISRLTGDWYTHASVALTDDLQTMYSFGRLWAYNPWIGGFVKESTEHGTMRRFRNADVVVMRVAVSDEKYDAIANYVTTMYADRKKYKYNYRGLFLSKRKVPVHSRKGNRFYCSEFVNDLLERFAIIERGEFGEVVRPMELLQLCDRGKAEIVYRGPLCKFAPTKD